jgi:hypothetical protein
LTAVTSGELSGTVTVPAGYSMYFKSISLQPVSNLQMGFIFDQSAATTFDYVTPVIANTSLVFTAVAKSAAGAISAVVKADQAAVASGLVFDIPAAPTLTSPANAATGVTVTTPFDWTSFPNGVSEFHAQSASGPTFYIFTSASTVNLPDLSAAGLPLPASTDYTWSIVAYSPITVDLIATPGGINAVTVDLDQSFSLSQTFTTGP